MLATVFLFACEDKAEPGFKKCAKLEAEGKLEDALTQCELAMVADDPESRFAKKAVEKHAAIERKLDEIIPPTITADWCSRFRKRLENRLAPAAAVK